MAIMDLVMEMCFGNFIGFVVLRNLALINPKHWDDHDVTIGQHVNDDKVIAELLLPTITNLRVIEVFLVKGNTSEAWGMWHLVCSSFAGWITECPRLHRRATRVVLTPGQAFRIHIQPCTPELVIRMNRNRNHHLDW
ncbi:hypothetical protein D3C87_1276290 [compost metagenome]